MARKIGQVVLDRLIDGLHKEVEERIILYNQLSENQVICEMVVQFIAGLTNYYRDTKEEIDIKQKDFRSENNKIYFKNIVIYEL